jgi:hypothetical protein
MCLLDVPAWCAGMVCRRVQNKFLKAVDNFAGAFGWLFIFGA